MKSDESLLIFGGSRGLGKKLALKLSSSRNKVVVLSRRKPDWITSAHACEHVSIDLSSFTKDDLERKIKPFLSLRPSLIFAQRSRPLNSMSTNNDFAVSMGSIGTILDYIINNDF